MRNITFSQKSRAALAFLLAVRLPEVARLLGEHGFDQQALDEGWSRLHNLSPSLPERPVDSIARTELAQLLEFQRRWFPITHAVLRATHPELERALFSGLRVKRLDPLLLVGLFVERLARAERGKEVRFLLEKRGLCWSEFEATQQLLVALSNGQAPGRADASRHAEREALDSLWAWYLE